MPAKKTPTPPQADPKPPQKARRKLTDQQAAFIVAYIENGFSKLADSYLKAYPTSSAWTQRERASQGHKIANSLTVKPHIDQARQRSNIALSGAVARAAMSKAEVLVDLGTLFQAARDERNYTGATKVGELMAKLQGWITERRDVRVIRSIEDLTDEELDVLIAGRSPVIPGQAMPATGGPVTPSRPVEPNKRS